MTATIALIQPEPAADPMPCVPAVATLRDVTKRFGNHLALDGLSLDLHAGEVVALLGANGAGKTTAIRHLLGLTRATSGDVRLFGLDPRSLAARRRVGAMLQVGAGGVPEMLKVREHIDLFRSYYDTPMQFEDVIRFANLEGLEDIRFGRLSGGQKQRLMFALALCGDPDLLFLDEPTVGMDVTTRHALWNQIRAVVAVGKTVLLTTHYLEEADQLADRILVINAGRLVAQGTPTQIKAAYDKRDIRCRTTLGDDMLAAVPGVQSVRREGAVVVLSTDDTDRTVRQLLQRDPNLTDLQIDQVALQDAFLALTGASATGSAPPAATDIWMKGHSA